MTFASYPLCWKRVLGRPFLSGIVHGFTDQNPETFERRMGDVVDGINRLEKNPFR